MSTKDPNFSKAIKLLTAESYRGVPYTMYVSLGAKTGKLNFTLGESGYEKDGPQVTYTTVPFELTKESKAALIELIQNAKEFRETLDA